MVEQFGKEPQEHLPAVQVFDSVDGMSNELQERFLEYFGAVFANSSSETGLVNGEMLSNWGTERIFVQESTSGKVIGTGLMLKSGDSEDCLTLDGLCYDKENVSCGQRILEAVVSTWKHNFSNFHLSVDLSKKNEFIRRAAQDVGFKHDEQASDDIWDRFLLTAQINSESDTDSQGASVQINNVPDHASSSSCYKCELCQKEFVMKYNMKKHRRTVHANEMVWCYFCEKSFKLKSQLKRHVKVVHEKRDFTECKTCSKIYSSKQALAKHIRNVHNKHLPFTCELCDKSFSAKKSLDNHVRIVHKRGRPFQCEQCDKTFRVKWCLKIHIRSVHEKQMPFRCEQCDKTFSQKGNFVNHVRKVHERSRPFECEQCA
eukprot:1013104_1